MQALAPDAKARLTFLGLVLALHVAMWTIAVSLAPSLMPRQQMLAESISTFALVLASVNLMLSTRPRFLERYLTGLDKLFVTHRTIGLSVALLVTAHFLIVPKSVGYVPSKPWGYTTLAFVLVTVFAASAPRFPWRRLVPLNYQTWKLAHRFNGMIVAMAATHSLFAHTYVRQVPVLAGYVYGVAALGLMAWLYRELLFPLTGPFSTFDVAQSKVLGGAVTEVTLAASSGSAIRDAGQFLFASFSGGPSREQHPFTVSSGTANDIRFSIAASGDFTSQLAGVPEGSTVRVEGPYGGFDYRRGLPHQLWLAGGIGITPFLSMAADLDHATRVLLVWSVREQREAYYRDELAAVARAKPNLRFELHPTSELGHLAVAALSLNAEPGEYSAFLCGPVPMRREFIAQLLSLGVPRKEIYFEEFRLR